MNTASLTTFLAITSHFKFGHILSWTPYLRDYATENEYFDRTKELVDEIIMHLNAKVSKRKNTKGNDMPLPKQIVKYCTRDNLMKKSDAVLEETLHVVKDLRSQKQVFINGTKCLRLVEVSISNSIS
jgi:hypothetical protein